MQRTSRKTQRRPTGGPSMPRPQSNIQNTDLLNLDDLSGQTSPISLGVNPIPSLYCARFRRYQEKCDEAVHVRVSSFAASAKVAKGRGTVGTIPGDRVRAMICTSSVSWSEERVYQNEDAW